MILVASYLSLQFVSLRVEIFLIGTSCDEGRWLFRGDYGGGNWVVRNAGGGVSVDGGKKVQA